MLHFTINNSNKVFIALELHKDCGIAAQASSQSLNPRKFYSTSEPNLLIAGCTWVPLWCSSTAPQALFPLCISVTTVRRPLGWTLVLPRRPSPLRNAKKEVRRIFYLQRQAQVARTFRLHAAQICMRDPHPCLAGRGLWLTPGGWRAEKARS